MKFESANKAESFYIAIILYKSSSDQPDYQPFIPLSQSGKDSIDNLALACFHCNRRKSAKTTALYPESGLEVPLFNPRQSLWSEYLNHYCLRGCLKSLN